MTAVYRPIHLSAEDHARVTAAVSKAEAATSGEIVTILAERSDGYTDVALAWSAALAFAALCALAVFAQPVLDALGGWNHEWSDQRLLWLAAATASLTFIVVFLVQLPKPIRFALIPGPIRTARVHARAINLFKVGAERRTHRRTGILIYLSMREHRAEILADETIAAKVDPETWAEAMAAMLERLRRGEVANAMIAGTERVSVVLVEHFPRNSEDTNEIPDRLIEL